MLSVTALRLTPCPGSTSGTCHVSRIECSHRLPPAGIGAILNPTKGWIQRWRSRGLARHLGADRIIRRSSLKGSSPVSTPVPTLTTFTWSKLAVHPRLRAFCCAIGGGLKLIAVLASSEPGASLVVPTLLPMSSPPLGAGALNVWNRQARPPEQVSRLRAPFPCHVTRRTIWSLGGASADSTRSRHPRAHGSMLEAPISTIPASTWNSTAA